MGRYWREWLQERFGDRPALPRDEAVRMFWSDLPSEQVADFFEMIETEYQLDVGLLRPDDNLERFTTPIKTKNPLRWFAVEPELEDSASELNYQIVQPAHRAGLATIWRCIPSANMFASGVVLLREV